MPMLLGHNRARGRRRALALLAIGLAAVLGFLLFRNRDFGEDHVRGTAARPNPGAAAPATRDAGPARKAS